MRTMSSKLYKVERDGEVWSLGYPTKSSAQAAARRMNKYCGPHPRFTSAEMTPADYVILTTLEDIDG